MWSGTERTSATAPGGHEEEALTGVELAVVPLTRACGDGHALQHLHPGAGLVYAAHVAVEDEKVYKLHSLVRVPPVRVTHPLPRHLHDWPVHVRVEGVRRHALLEHQARRVRVVGRGRPDVAFAVRIRVPPVLSCKGRRGRRKAGRGCGSGWRAVSNTDRIGCGFDTDTQWELSSQRPNSLFLKVDFIVKRAVWPVANFVTNVKPPGVRLFRSRRGGGQARGPNSVCLGGFKRRVAVVGALAEELRRFPLS